MSSKFQLRRIGLPPSMEDIKNCYSIFGNTYIGRGKGVDIFLDSNIRKGLISRAHAHILTHILDSDETVYRIYDTSLNGTYVNDIRIENNHILRDGDKIAFGHLRGAIIDPGELAPQKETEFLFKFEICTKDEVIDLSETNIKKEIYCTNMEKEQILPGVLPALNNHERNLKNNGIEKKPLQDSGINSIDQDDLELNSIVSSVTSKILNEGSSQEIDSFNLEISFKTEMKDEISENLSPIQPRKGLFDHLKRPDSPISISSGSDHGIKRDTSLSITHVYENVEPEFLSEALRSKVREVFRDHETKRTIENDFSRSKLRRDIHIPIDDEGDDDESIFSDKSEEIPDSGSDSDFVPEKSENLDSIPHTRTRKVKLPSRFSPQHTKKQKLNDGIDKKKRIKPVQKKQQGQFIHDVCAAWDCIRPSGTIKQITWVACDDCDKWYHVSCSGLSAKSAMKTNTNYHCGCS